jgi:hypothetical protein
VSNAGIPELVKRLQELRKDVFLVSGGFRPIINPIAEMLGIPLDHVYANTILYQVGTPSAVFAQDATLPSMTSAFLCCKAQLCPSSAGEMCATGEWQLCRL